MRCVLPVLISIHALLAESDVKGAAALFLPAAFLSTLSLRRATTESSRLQARPQFLSTLSLRRATGISVDTLTSYITFLSTLSLRRATKPAACIQPAVRLFLSTLSLRRATAAVRQPAPLPLFLSTLSLRRATFFPAPRPTSINNFYPRSPCGERQGVAGSGSGATSFLSTLVNNPVAAVTSISIHALLAESDAHTAKNTSMAGHFYPRSPCGERRAYLIPSALRRRFLSTLSLRRATPVRVTDCAVQGDFYPRSPCGERPDSGIGAWRYRYFYPRSPCGERLQSISSSSLSVRFLSTLSLRRATPSDQ